MNSLSSLCVREKTICKTVTFERKLVDIDSFLCLSFFLLFIFYSKMLSRILVPRSTIHNLARIATIRSFGTRINPLFQKDDTVDEVIKPTKQGRANEIIEAVLYGSKKIKEIENQTHSKMLARGKYVHELQSIYYISRWCFFLI
jgi:hypothetical protein